MTHDQYSRVHGEIASGLAGAPLLDIHTHLDAGHLSARGLHDILLYHMIVSDLASAGCPSRARLSEDPGEAEAHARLAEAVQFVPHIRNTSGYWGVRIILRDLYGWQEEITPDNWRTLDARIRAQSADPAWPREILRRCGVRRAGTELWRRREGQADDLLQYALEWAFFARAQWGVNDIPLFELERAWSQEEPGAPLPVTLGEGRPALDQVIRGLDDVHAALAHYVARIPYDRVLSTAQHISTDLNLREVSQAEMAAALLRRDAATTADRDIYASYILEAFLTELEQRRPDLLYQFSVGAEPLPYETGSKLRQDTISEIAGLAARHPGVRFQVFLASEHGNQGFCTVARELPNVSLAGYWWHNLFPGVIRKVMSDRLDMLAANKQVGFFSDAYCVEWTYAKAAIIRAQMAEVLATKVAQGQYVVEDALAIARAICYETPKTLNGMSDD
jgi:hypothetical protein